MNLFVRHNSMKIFSFMLFFFPLTGFADDSKTARIAIIIDDIGYQLHQGRRSIDLPGAVTLAIIPFTPNAQRLAKLGHDAGKEIMLHAPMANESGTPMEVGALNANMNKDAFTQRLRESLDSLPHISGLNNHMGSLLTQQQQPMTWLMTELKQRQLYFVDSRTSANSLAWQSAQEKGLPSLKRDIFLDHERSPEFIHAQFQRLIHIAQKKGQAIGIGHPYPETLRYLNEHLPSLAQYNVELVRVSSLMENGNKSNDTPVVQKSFSAADGYDLPPLFYTLKDRPSATVAKPAK
jgi:polysaccharide deacetylase 2 family uncharacterized protein YibQ